MHVKYNIVYGRKFPRPENRQKKFFCGNKPKDRTKLGGEKIDTKRNPLALAFNRTIAVLRKTRELRRKICNDQVLLRKDPNENLKVMKKATKRGREFFSAKWEAGSRARVAKNYWKTD